MVEPDPTDEQQAFIDGQPDAVLIACPGSGKTAACARRFIRRVRLRPGYGVAYLSYTNTAVDEARKRIENLEATDLIKSPNFVGTIDSFFQRFIFLPFISHVHENVDPGRIRVFGTGGGESPPVELARSSAYDFYNGKHASAKSWQTRTRIVNGATGFFESGSNLPLARDAAKECYDKKKSYLRAGFASHNDVLLWNLTIIKKLPRAIDIVRARFGEIIVDEAQDTSPLQQHLFRLLEQKGVQISYVGDPDQSIYQFNDAYPTFLKDLASTRPNSYKLTVNHRSSAQILDRVKAHFGVAMVATFSSLPPNGAFVTVVSRADCASHFKAILADCNIPLQEAVILFRDADGIRQLTGGVSTEKMNDAAKRLLGAIQALALQEYPAAASRAGSFLRVLCVGDGIEEQGWREMGWIYLRSFLPSFSGITVQEWVVLVRQSLERFCQRRNVTLKSGLSSNFTRRGFPTGSADQALQPSTKPMISVRSIHEAKGESIKAVMLHGKDSQHKIWLAGRKLEWRCLSFVAMTRAEQLLILGCESSAVATKWVAKGFTLLQTGTAP